MLPTVFADTFCEVEPVHGETGAAPSLTAPSD
jgi:hypothetical protein